MYLLTKKNKLRTVSFEEVEMKTSFLTSESHSNDDLKELVYEDNEASICKIAEHKELVTDFFKTSFSVSLILVIFVFWWPRVLVYHLVLGISFYRKTLFNTGYVLC